MKKSENVEGRTPAIEITLPKDLEQAVCLKITIESPSSQGTTPLTEVYFRGDRPAIRQGMKLWNQKLITAQRTLLCRDLYAQVSSSYKISHFRHFPVRKNINLFLVVQRSDTFERNQLLGSRRLYFI